MNGAGHPAASSAHAVPAAQEAVSAYDSNGPIPTPQPNGFTPISAQWPQKAKAP